MTFTGRSFSGQTRVGISTPVSLRALVFHTVKNQDHGAPLRAVIYNRASADKSGQRVSVESQDTENHAWCEREGWEVVATVTDNDRSATRYATREREGYKQICAGLASGQWGKVDLLVMWESSRGERTMDGHVELRHLCSQLGVKLAYRGRVLNMADGDDRFSAGLDALVDEREAERIRDRILRGHQASVRAGKPRGAVPYGYRREYSPGSGMLLKQLPDPETAPVVQGIVRDILAGQTLYAIAQRLNRDGVFTPQQARDGRRGVTVERGGWTSSMIRNLLKKRSLMGERTHRGVIVGQGTWDPIVSPADWKAVQTLLTGPGRASYHGGLDVKWLLSGIATCGVCGGWMRPMLNRGRMTYRCDGLTPTSPRGHVVRDQPNLDAWVTARVVGRLLRPDALDVFRPPARSAAPRLAQEQELADVRARLAEYELSAGSPGGVSAAAFARIEARLSARIAELEQALAPPVEVPREVVAMAGPDAETVWDGFSLAGKRRVVRAMCDIAVGPVAQRGRRGFEGSSIRLVWRSS